MATKANKTTKKAVKKTVAKTKTYIVLYGDDWEYGFDTALAKGKNPEEACRYFDDVIGVFELAGNLPKRERPAIKTLGTISLG